MERRFGNVNITRCVKNKGNRYVNVTNKKGERRGLVHEENFDSRSKT